MKNNLIIQVYKQPQSVFTLAQIALLFPEMPYTNLKRMLSYAVSSSALKKLGRGVYAKERYDLFEAANKLYVPSYISLETVLQRAGVTFQYYEKIFAMSYVTRTLIIDGQTIAYQRLRKEVLLNTDGIEKEGNVVIASPERAFLDAVFVYKNYHFDNLDALNWEKVQALVPIYSSNILAKRIREYRDIAKEERV